MAALRLSTVDFYDRTLYELSLELDAYSLQWEEHWAPFRALYTLTYNLNATKGKTKKAWELIPFPSEAEEIAWQKKWSERKELTRLRQTVEGNGGSGIIS